MNKNKFLEKTIAELEGWSWNTSIPSDESSYGEKQFYKLHSKKLKDYTPDDLRFMIGQESGLEYLIPMAIEILKDDIYIYRNRILPWFSFGKCSPCK